MERILQALIAHTYLENECMDSSVCELLPDLEEDLPESFEETRQAGNPPDHRRDRRTDMGKTIFDFEAFDFAEPAFVLGFSGIRQSVV